MKKLLSLAFAGVVAVLSIPAYAADNPSEPGEYQVGYREVTVIDSSRATGADLGGRVLEVGIWYPIDDDVAATGIPAAYDLSTESMLLYGIPLPFVIISSDLNAKVDSSSVIAPTLVSPDDPACDDPFSVTCATNQIVGLPVSSNGPFEVIAWSHGVATIPAVYLHFLEHLASHGYIVVAPRHSGSSLVDLSISALTGGLDCSVFPVRPCVDVGTTSPINRPQDISFVLDKLFDGSLGGDLQLAANPNKIGVAGHSMGGHTALMLGGGLVAATGSLNPGDLKDSRIKAIYAMSPATGSLLFDDFNLLNPIVFPEYDLASIDVPVVINYAQYETNVGGENFVENAQQSFVGIDTGLVGEKFLIEMLGSGHNHVINFCQQEILDVFKLGNDNPLGTNALYEIVLFTSDLAKPRSSSSFVGKSVFGQQALCENDFFYEPTNLFLFNAITLVPPAPPIPLSALLLNAPPFSIPLNVLPGFIDDSSFSFVPTRTGNAVINDIKAYMLSAFNVYLRHQAQYERFIRGIPGLTTVEKCFSADGLEQCKIK